MWRSLPTSLVAVSTHILYPGTGDRSQENKEENKGCNLLAQVGEGSNKEEGPCLQAEHTNKPTLFGLSKLVVL